jgi:hypothetical protein
LPSAKTKIKSREGFLMDEEARDGGTAFLSGNGQ